MIRPQEVFAAPHDLIRTNQEGVLLTKENSVDYIAANRRRVAAITNQLLLFGDALETHTNSRAHLRLKDWNAVKLDSFTRLEIVRPSRQTNEPVLKIQSGRAYFSSRGPAKSMPVSTPHVKGVPKGTEFLVRVENTTTEFIMLDGEVELENPHGMTVLKSGEQSLIEEGKAPTKPARFEGKSLVQWWIYYPAIVDPQDLGLTIEEQTKLQTSLRSYQRGSLLDALLNYPRHDTPVRLRSDRENVYLAALQLAIGAVDQTEALLSELSNTNTPGVRALRLMIQSISRGHEPNATLPATASLGFTNTTSELLALSYACQSTNGLREALHAARSATRLAPAFGFAWARRSELEFSLGLSRAARDSVAMALMSSPSNAQAHCVQGFLLAADYRLTEALSAFDRALDIEPALGNAWLGRGLCKRRLGILAKKEFRSTATENTSSWLADLQTAAITEPSRSLVRSYAGKGFSDAGDGRLALKELDYAEQLDPNDPTPPLYKALEFRKQNRPNEAVQELERSVTLNDNRAIYRSRLLLDQDHATRSASLAKIYQDAGLEDVGLREAARAVSYDYANYSAHQFLAESYNALRDPTRFNLRHETVWFNELLIANLLSPVGAGLLSQNISQQEYSPLFEANRFGLLTSTEYRSDGQFREVASHYGLLGRTSYTLDLDYQHNEGTRPNNELNRIECYIQLKHQLTDRDSVFLLTKYQDYESGDNFQHLDWRTSVRTNFQFDEIQAPAMAAGYHHEWSPGSHTLMLAGRLVNDQQISDRDATNYVPIIVTNTIVNVPGAGFDSKYRSEFEIYSAELSQIFQVEHHTLVLGSRVQSGVFETSEKIGLGASSIGLANFAGFSNAFPHSARSEVDFDRLVAYAYYTWEPINTLAMTAGINYDHLRYPENYRNPPINSGSADKHGLNPKAAFVWTPSPKVTLRSAYTRSFGGVSYDQSYQLEPSQLAGFSQSFRNVISESLVGSLSAPEYQTAGLGLDLKFDRQIYLGFQAEFVHAEVNRTLGVFQTTPLILTAPVTAGGIRQHLRYDERTASISANKLLSEEWSFGLRYRVTDSALERRIPEVRTALLPDADRRDEALLHEFRVSLLFTHGSGFFVQTEGAWYLQTGYEVNGSPRSRSELDGASFPQVNLMAGYRFPRRRGDISLGLLNATDEDYQLTSLTPYAELPHERVIAVRLRTNF